MKYYAVNGWFIIDKEPLETGWYDSHDVIIKYSEDNNYRCTSATTKNPYNAIIEKDYPIELAEGDKVFIEVGNNTFYREITI